MWGKHSRLKWVLSGWHSKLPFNVHGRRPCSSLLLRLHEVKDQFCQFGRAGLTVLNDLRREVGHPFAWPLVRRQGVEHSQLVCCAIAGRTEGNNPALDSCSSVHVAREAPGPGLMRRLPRALALMCFLLVATADVGVEAAEGVPFCMGGKFL